MEGTITEYQWPLQGGELYMIQEQVSDFLEITSFKRKYPDIFRRTVDPEEKAYLRENGLVSEAHCDLGLIAVKSSDVLDIMFADFQDKYEEFRKQIRDKQARELSSKHKAAFTSLLLDKRKFENRVLDAKTEAMQAAAAWNSRLNRARTEQRRCMLDLQSMIVHYPRTVGEKRSRVPNPPARVGHYPVALVPGQFCDHYKKYNANELKYFPLNTVIYGPMKPNERFGGGSDGSQSDTDSSSSSDDSSDSSSESSEDSAASGDESNDRSLATAAGTAKERQPSGETHCKVCGGDKTRNKQDNPEVLINCAQCTKSSQLMQLNRLPTVLLSNCSIKSPMKTAQTTSSSLSKLLKQTGTSPSPIKRLKTETGFVATDSPKPNIARVLGAETPKPNFARILGTETPKPNVARVLGTDATKPNVARILGTSSPITGKVLGTDSPKPNIVRVLGTQVVKVQGNGGTQFIKTQEGQNIRLQKIQEGQSIRVMGTQIVKAQEVAGMKVIGTQMVKPQGVTGAQNIMGTQIVKPQEVAGVKGTGTQEAQIVRVMGTQVVKPQEVSSMGNPQDSQKVMGAQIVNPQEAQRTQMANIQANQNNEAQQPPIVKTEGSPLRGIRRFGVGEQMVESQNLQSSKAEVDLAVQSIKFEESEAVKSIEENHNFEAQSSNTQESQKVEALETQSVEAEGSQNVIAEEVMEAQEIPSVHDSQNDEVAEEQCILESKRLEAQSIQTQESENFETQDIEVQGSQNAESEEAEFAKPSPEQVISSDSSSTLQSNTVGSDSTVNSVDKADTKCSTVEMV